MGCEIVVLKMDEGATHEGLEYWRSDIRCRGGWDRHRGYCDMSLSGAVSQTEMEKKREIDMRNNQLVFDLLEKD